MMRYMVRVTRESGVKYGGATRWTSKPAPKARAEAVRAAILSGVQAGPWGSIGERDTVALVPEYGSVLGWAAARG